MNVCIICKTVDTTEIVYTKYVLNGLAGLSSHRIVRHIRTRLVRQKVIEFIFSLTEQLELHYRICIDDRRPRACAQQTNLDDHFVPGGPVLFDPGVYLRHLIEQVYEQEGQPDGYPDVQQHRQPSHAHGLVVLPHEDPQCGEEHPGSAGGGCFPRTRPD